jgi:hypothetical protein
LLIQYLQDGSLVLGKLSNLRKFVIQRYNGWAIKHPEHAKVDVFNLNEKEAMPFYLTAELAPQIELSLLLNVSTMTRTLNNLNQSASALQLIPSFVSYIPSVSEPSLSSSSMSRTTFPVVSRNAWNHSMDLFIQPVLCDPSSGYVANNESTVHVKFMSLEILILQNMIILPLVRTPGVSPCSSLNFDIERKIRMVSGQVFHLNEPLAGRFYTKMFLDVFALRCFCPQMFLPSCTETTETLDCEHVYLANSVISKELRP